MRVQDKIFLGSIQIFQEFVIIYLVLVFVRVLVVNAVNAVLAIVV